MYDTSTLLSLCINWSWAYYVWFFLRAFCCSKLILISITSFTLFRFNTIFFSILPFESHFITISFIEHFESILILLQFAMIHFTLAIYLIHDSIQRSNVVTLKSNLSSTFNSFVCLCIMWHLFASSHHDFDSCKFQFYFTFFNSITMNMCCAYVVCDTISYPFACFVSILFPLSIFISFPIR